MRTKVKILLVLLLIGIIYFCFGKNEVQAKQLSTPLYFGINEMRTLSTPNLGYAIGNPRNNDQDGKGIKLWNILKYSTSTSNDPTEVDVYCVKSGVGFANDTHRRATYNFEFNMYTEREEIAAKSTTLNGLVNGGHYNELLALANILYLAEDETEDLEAYLKKAGISKEYWDELLTVDEVKAVQQAAIWYFTNYGEENGKYDKTNATAWLNYTTDGFTYTSLADYGLGNNRVGYQRQQQAEILYKYLIKTAKANSGNYEDSSKNYKTKLVLYTAQGVNGEEQPLMEIKREKQFDLSLRKYITKINNVSVNVSREPQIDLTNLKNETQTTATYKHKKDPILVQNGDIVTYNIRVYNEGDVDGYVNKIVDQLPTGLKFNKLITTGYMATYNEEDNIVTITRNEDNKDRLTAFDGNNLDYTTLEIECTVKTQEGDKVLTNVAWIAEEQTIDGNIITNEIGDDRDSEPSTKPDVNKDNMEDYKGKDDNKDDLTDKDYFYEGQQDDDDFEKLITKKIEGNYNLQIVKVDNKDEEVKLSGAEFKITMPDGSSITETTDGSGVINLGNISITETGIDNIKVEELNAPEGYGKIFDSFELDVTKEEQGGKYVVTNVDLKNSQGSEITTGEIKVNYSNGMITMTVPNKKLDGSYNLQIVKVDNEDENIKLSGAEFKITMPDGSIRTEITDSSGNINIGTIKINNVKDNDVITIEEIKAPDGYNMILQKIVIEVEKQEINGIYSIKNATLVNGEANISIDGNNINISIKNTKMEEFDLALRKFIIAVSEDETIEDKEYLKNPDGSYAREPQVDTSLLNTINSNGKLITTAIYNHTKVPVTVEKENYIVYMIRVYNEGDIAGYASEIKDHLPPYLEFVDNEFNSEYGWELSEDGRTVTTRYLENSLINAAEKNEDGKYELSYVDVPIMCKIKAETPSNENITNIADITEYQDEDKKPVEDRDSQEDNVELPEDEELPGYKDEEEGEYIPGQQDDDDFEKVIIKEKYFDLALRKFIIAVSNDETVEDEEYLTNADGSYTRAPVVDTSLLNTTDENGNMITTAIYNHTKEPLIVQANDYVIYMLRVYNEGEMDGYASEIKDHLPPYLEFVDNEFNSEYGWEVSEDGRTVTTRYLENSLIDAAKKNEEGTYVLSYVEVPIMCRITEDAPTSANITNIADITEYQDENKNPTTDRDSQEDNVELPEDEELPGYKDEEEGDYIPGQQDDDDFEKVIIKEFDLSLRKWVTQAIVIDDKGETITETGHQPYDDPEEIVKVEIYRKSINDVTVKFRYKIRVTNEGEIEGYAKEITDYVPEGLRFLPEDNPKWTDEGNNVISTRLLENTLLQPGEYAEVEVVLTWINDADNMGVKINTAEISEDYNDYDVPDKDSTPDNQEEGEDDIDDAKVLLSVSTGQVRIYFTLGFIVLITVASGIVLIKKFVL